MSPADSRSGRPSVMVSLGRWVPPTRAGLPGSSVSLSERAVPNHPGQVPSAASARSSPSGNGLRDLWNPWPLGYSVTRSNRVHLRYGSLLCLRRLRREQLPVLAAPLATRRTSTSHGRLLSSC